MASRSYRLRQAMHRAALVSTLGLLAIGCSSDSASKEVPAASETTVATPPKADVQPLSVLVAKFDDVWAKGMGDSDSKFGPLAKSVVRMKTADAAAAITKNKELLARVIAQSQQAALDLSTSTGSNVSVQDHDAYVAYFTAVSQRIGSRKAAAQSMLDLARLKTEASLTATRDAVRFMDEADSTYKQLKTSKS